MYYPGKGFLGALRNKSSARDLAADVALLALTAMGSGCSAPNQTGITETEVPAATATAPTLGLVSTPTVAPNPTQQESQPFSNFTDYVSACHPFTDQGEVYNIVTDPRCQNENAYVYFELPEITSQTLFVTDIVTTNYQGTEIVVERHQVRNEEDIVDGIDIEGAIQNTYETIQSMGEEAGIPHEDMIQALKPNVPMITISFTEWYRVLPGEYKCAILPHGISDQDGTEVINALMSGDHALIWDKAGLKHYYDHIKEPGRPDLFHGVKQAGVHSPAMMLHPSAETQPLDEAFISISILDFLGEIKYMWQPFADHFSPGDRINVAIINEFSTLSLAHLQVYYPEIFNTTVDLHIRRYGSDPATFQNPDVRREIATTMTQLHAMRQIVERTTSSRDDEETSSYQTFLDRVGQSSIFYYQQVENGDIQPIQNPQERMEYFQLQALRNMIFDSSFESLHPSARAGLADSLVTQFKMLTNRYKQMEHLAQTWYSLISANPNDQRAQKIERMMTRTGDPTQVAQKIDLAAELLWELGITFI